MTGAWRRNWRVTLGLTLTAMVPADALWLAPRSRPAFWVVLVALVAAGAIAGWGGVPGWWRLVRAVAVAVVVAARCMWALHDAASRIRQRRAQAAWVARMRRRAGKDARRPACPLPPELWAYLSRERGHRP